MESIGKKLHKKDMRLHAFLETHNEIYLYGAGRAAEELIYYLKEEGRNISGIIVTDKTDNDDFFYDIKSISLKTKVHQWIKMAAESNYNYS